MSKRSEGTDGQSPASGAATKPKERRGTFARLGFGRGGSEAGEADAPAGVRNAAPAKSESTKAEPAKADPNANGSKPAAPTQPTKPADVVAAPAVRDGEAPARAAAPVNAQVKMPVAERVTAKVPAAETPAAEAPAAEAPAAKAPAAKAPAAKAPAAGAPSQATSARPDKPAPSISDAPIPRSRLGRTKGTEASRAPRVRRARLKIANIDPWSVMKVSFLFSVALGVILLVAVALLWLLLDFMGFFATVASTVEDISGDEGTSGFDVVGFFSLPRVLGGATIVALIDIVMITALTTLAAYLYNISTDLVGGVEVTLAEEE